MAITRDALTPRHIPIPIALMKECVSLRKRRGWLAQDLASRPTQFELMFHPDDGEILPELLEYACARSESQQWLVPEYQALVAELLIQRGFTEAAKYVMLIKTMAATVRAPYLSPREAKVW